MKYKPIWALEDLSGIPIACLSKRYPYLSSYEALLKEDIVQK